MLRLVILKQDEVPPVEGGLRHLPHRKERAGQGADILLPQLIALPLGIWLLGRLLGVPTSLQLNLLELQLPLLAMPLLAIAAS